MKNRKIYQEMEDKAEEARLRYKYRKLIQSGKIRLPYRSAARIIGPDTAYHLYHNLEKPEPRSSSGQAENH